MQKYQLLKDRFEHKAGTIVYKCRRPTYGLERDDSNLTGEEHLAVSLAADGDYPFFTVPESAIRKVEE